MFQFAITLTGLSRALQILAGLSRVKNKVTGVEFWDKERSLFLYRTLPNIKTGGNLTMTIIADLFNKRMFDEAEELYINWDGSADNVNYTCVFAFVHLLLCAEQEGWPLRSIVVLRFLVGHTHNHLDATFGKASQETYGTHSRGDSRRDILDFEQLHEFFEGCFDGRLKAFTHLKGCYDWDSFVKSYKTPSLKNIQRHFAINLIVKDGVVTYRHKSRCNDNTPWSAPQQVFPPPNRARSRRKVSPNPPKDAPGIAPFTGQGLGVEFWFCQGLGFRFTNTHTHKYTPKHTHSDTHTHTHTPRVERFRRRKQDVIEVLQQRDEGDGYARASRGRLEDEQFPVRGPRYGANPTLMGTMGFQSPSSTTR